MVLLHVAREGKRLLARLPFPQHFLCTQTVCVALTPTSTRSYGSETLTCLICGIRSDQKTKLALFQSTKASLLSGSLRHPDKTPGEEGGVTFFDITFERSLFSFWGGTLIC